MVPVGSEPVLAVLGRQQGLRHKRGASLGLRRIHARRRWRGLQARHLRQRSAPSQPLPKHRHAAPYSRARRHDALAPAPAKSRRPVCGMAAGVCVVRATRSSAGRHSSTRAGGSRLGEDPAAVLKGERRVGSGRRPIHTRMRHALSINPCAGSALEAASPTGRPQRPNRPVAGGLTGRRPKYQGRTQQRARKKKNQYAANKSPDAVCWGPAFAACPW